MRTKSKLLSISSMLTGALLLAPIALSDANTGVSGEGMAPQGSASKTFQASSSATGKLPTFTTMQFPLSRSARLEEATSIRNVAGFEVVAYRFQSADIVGEYSADSSLSTSDFIADFVEQFGTEPQIESVIVELSTKDAERIYRSGDLPVIDLQGPDFMAAPANPSLVDQLMSARRSAHTPNPGQSARGEGDVMPLLTPMTWKPEQADIQIFEYSNDIYFSQFFYWGGTYANTGVLDSTLGFEMQVDITTQNPGSQTGTRPACLNPNFKEQPFATNVTNSWTWYIYVNAGYGMYPINLSSIDAYADYNDLGDACKRNSMSIGIRTPQALPAYPTLGIQEILVTILADKGVDSTGEISGAVQPVSESWCVTFPWLSNTDCMGVTPTTETSRPTLSASRQWTAPPICWISMDYGLTAPMQYC